MTAETMSTATAATHESCPCGSGRGYQDCCEPIILKKVQASNPEALMRSRYTAYAKHEMNWLKDSLAPKDRAGFDLQSSQAWAQKSEWLGLTIVKTDKGGPEDSTGQVEFIARFAVDGQTHDHHEISTFSRVDGEWFFVDGKPVKPPPFRHETPKVGRNDACPCGSGKKYKKCCGK